MGKVVYNDLVMYVKEHHVNWNTDLFDVLRGFFEECSQPPAPPSPVHSQPVQQRLVFEERVFREPDGGEYSIDDLLDLFST